MNPLLIPLLVVLALLVVAVAVILELRTRAREHAETFEQPVDNEWNWPLRAKRLP